MNQLSSLPSANACTDPVVGMSEADRHALNAITLATEFLMTAARAISRGFPSSHPEVTEPLLWARMKMPAHTPSG